MWKDNDHVSRETTQESVKSIQNYTTHTVPFQTWIHKEAAMRIALLSDVHSNLIALEAVLKAIKMHTPDMIVSLGDQVNLGPCPRETLAMLRENGVTCLHGNHERYILAAMDNHPGYQGANFNQLRYNASLLKKEEITFEKQMKVGHVTLCHAMPEDDRFPIYDPEKALILLADTAQDKPVHIICGHGHNQTNVTAKNLRIESIGSVGCMDDAPAGIAPYAILTIQGSAAALRPYYAAYNTKQIKPMYLQTNMPEYCPIMARIACMQMMTNTDIIVPFVDAANALSKARGEKQISEETWADADRAYPWLDGMTTKEFWQRR